MIAAGPGIYPTADSAYCGTKLLLQNPTAWYWVPIQHPPCTPGLSGRKNNHDPRACIPLPCNVTLLHCHCPLRHHLAAIFCLLLSGTVNKVFFVQAGRKCPTGEPLVDGPINEPSREGRDPDIGTAYGVRLLRRYRSTKKLWGFRSVGGTCRLRNFG
jgi:hypothetical protein